MDSSLIQSIGSFSCATALAYGFTWLARYWAPRWGFVDKPDGGRKKHSQATPLLGGVAIYLAFCGTFSAFLGLGVRSQIPGDMLNVAVLIGSGALFCLLGLIDDKRPLRARDKLLLQIVAALPYAIWGRPIEAVSLVGIHLELGPWSLVFAVFWLVSCANIVNLVDGLDGLASSVGLIAMASLAFMLQGGGDAVVSLVALAFAGSVAGFLVHNWPPARIFLGDAGSLTIGFMVGAVSIQAAQKTAAGFMLVFPLVLLSVPILDTAMAILRRKLTGRGIGEADRGHIHHRLQDRGLTKLQTLLAIAGICLAMAVTCLLAAVYSQDLLAIVVCGGVIAVVVAARLFGFHEVVLVLRHFEILYATGLNALRDLTVRRMLVHLEHDEQGSFDSRSDSVFSCVECVGGQTLDITCRSEQEDGDLFQRAWASESGLEQQTGHWHFRYLIPRDDGLLSSFLVSGYRIPGAKAPRFDQLVQVFEAWGRHLPEMDELRQRDVSVKIHSADQGPSTDVPAQEVAEVRRAA